MKKELVIKFLRGKCPPTEEQELYQSLENPDERKLFSKLMEEEIENTSPLANDLTDYTGLLVKIHQRVKLPNSNKKPTVKLLTVKSLKIAATLFMILFSGYFLSQPWLKNQDKAKWTADALKIYERTTGIGEKLTLTMPDGTRVIVNSESTIQFSSAYGHEERRITLKGEAYFEVAPDSLKPFFVNAGEGITQALGTAFNVSTKDDRFQVALVEGKVKVAIGQNSTQLNPGQMAVWKHAKNTAEIRVKQFNIEEITAWKEGKLNLKNTALGKILKDLEHRYDVSFEIDPDLDLKQRISGAFENKNLINVLTGLSFSTAFTFEINEKQVILTKRL
ncbi:FecR family protein [Cyclobacterium marinum]|nr:FecR domain-containing protein [Cyclobacterium marinum]